MTDEERNQMINEIKILLHELSDKDLEWIKDLVVRLSA